MAESDLVARTSQAIDLESWVRRCNLADERARRRGLNRAEVRVESLALRALLADNERLTTELAERTVERDAAQEWRLHNVATAERTMERALAAEARADAAEAHIARLAEDVESIYRRVVNTVDPAQSGPNVKRACLDVIRAAASVVSETGEKP